MTEKRKHTWAYHTFPFQEKPLGREIITRACLDCPYSESIVISPEDWKKPNGMDGKNPNWFKEHPEQKQ